MALYRNGTAGMTANGVVTGVGTNWQDKLSLVRVGATIVFMTQPLTLAVVSAIVSPTELRVIQSENAVVPDGTKYVILLHDSITVDGLAQDVAETLRFYQSKETALEEAVIFFKNFDFKALQDLQTKVTQDADRADAAGTSAWNARNQAEALAADASASKVAAATSAQQAANYNTLASQSAALAQDSKNAAAGSASTASGAASTATSAKNSAETAAFNARTSETKAGQSEAAALASKNAAATSEANANTWASQSSQNQQAAAASQIAAAGSATAAGTSAAAASADAARAKAEADRAAASNPDNSLLKANNLSDLADKAVSRKNLSLERIVQTSTYTAVTAPDSARIAVFNGRSVGFLDGSGVYFGLPVASGGTGAMNEADARTNLGLGTSSTPQFARQVLASIGASSSGALSLQRKTSANVAMSDGLIYTEVQNSVHKMTFGISADGSPGTMRFMQFDYNGDLAGLRNIPLGGQLSAKNITTAYWSAGGDKSLAMISQDSDMNSGNFVNYVQGKFYGARWEIGGVRGSGANLDRVQINVDGGTGTAASFTFRPEYGGYITSMKGIRGYCGAIGWGSEGIVMSAPFWAETVANNESGFAPVVSGATQNVNGYGTRVSLGAVGQGNNSFAHAALSINGDGRYSRIYQFSPQGNLFSWGNGIWTGNDVTFQSSPTSDRDLKHDIQYTEGKESYDRVMSWLPTMFKYKGSDVQRFGLIAQDLMKVDDQYVRLVPGSPIFEDVMKVDENGEEIFDRQVEVDRRDDTLALDANVMLADLGCAFVYQGNQVEELKKEVEDLKLLVKSLINK